MKRLALTSSLLFLACLSGVLASGPARAVVLPCQSTVYTSVTLTADIVCPYGWNGLIVGADGIRIDLNGYNIINTTPVFPQFWTRGIVSIGFKNVEIVGPGTITGFASPIEFRGSDRNLISGVTAIGLGGFPLLLVDSSETLVTDSRITSLRILSEQGKAYRNQVIGNRIGLPGLDGGFVDMSGCDTVGNVVTGNRIDDTYGVLIRSVRILGGAHDNEVSGNRMKLVSVVIEGGTGNVVSKNDISLDPSQAAGIAIRSSFLNGYGIPPNCGSVTVLPGDMNVVHDNRVTSGRYGVTIADTDPVVATGNIVTRNTFVDQQTAGMFFDKLAQSNDGSGNTYVNAPQAVIDRGTGNLWP